MNDIYKMRESVKLAYNCAPKWVQKVNKMNDDQVTAIYLKFRKEGLI